MGRGATRSKSYSVGIRASEHSSEAVACGLASGNCHMYADIQRIPLLKSERHKSPYSVVHVHANCQRDFRLTKDKGP